MKKLIFVLLVKMYAITSLGQSMGVLCMDFQINDERRSEGVGFRRSLESVLSNLKHPPIIIDREKIQEVILKVQEEFNLKKDLNMAQVKELQAAQVDYLLYGNLDKSFVSSNYDLQLQFIKISGENAFSKKTFPILSFSEKELANGELFRNKLAVLLSEYAFTKDFGIIENSQLDLIIKSLDQKDLQIKKLDSSLINVESDAKEKGEIIKNLSVSVKKLQEESQLKDKELTNLKKGVSDIKDYASVARLNLFGLEHTYAYPLKFETELSNLMEKAIYVKSNQVLFYVNDSAIQWLTIAIEKYPKFPFSYYAMFEILLRMNKKKCLEYAYNCIEILKITTTIEGHHKQHDDALKQLIGTVADIEQHRPIIIMEKDKPVLVNPIN